jgi:drug/metabolite transporter (DMT)-like permease
VALLLGVLVRGETVALLSIVGSAVCVAGAVVMRRGQNVPQRGPALEPVPYEERKAS